MYQMGVKLEGSWCWIMFKKIIFQLFPIIGIVLCCCSSAPSLQTYFVDNQEKNGFISIDVPISVLGLESIEMSSSEKEALSSISKFNILSFSLDSINHTKYSEELLKINQLFTNSSYERIISLGNPKDGKVRVYTVDNNGFLKEIVIFVNSNKTGFAIIRVLGNEMELEKFLKLRRLLNEIDLSKLTKIDFNEFIF